ncbi:hypothetical protein OF83DRAFT_1054948 [Amylostereum chailletii]|nr:hypothetical protein OF83DRAFT_1054948 [Amylostereum chailletii]
MPDPSVLAHVTDVHCHPTDSGPVDNTAMKSLPITICAMASKMDDQGKVRELAENWPDKVVPAFGYHPWWSHHIALTPTTREEHYRGLFLPAGVKASDVLASAFSRLLPSLPEPVFLSTIVSTLRENLLSNPRAMLGEVGLDRAARVPFPPSSSAEDEPREFSPFTTPLAHQLAVIEAQIAIAVELRRNVSLHSVKAPQQTRELLDRMAVTYGESWRAISVDLHSCGVSPQVWAEIEKRHPNAFLSLSKAINARSPNHLALIKACDPARLLVESDYPDVRFVAEQTWAMIETIAEVRGWRVETTWEQDAGDKTQWGVVRRLEANWQAFVRGRHVPERKERKRARRMDFSYQDWESEDEGEAPVGPPV